MDEQSVFVAALEREDPAERSAFVRQACSDNPELRQRVEKLLEVNKRAGDFLETPAAPMLLPPDKVPGTLGDYRIIREIARGGMGVVYEAEQISLERRVALKVLPFAAMLDQRQLQRFQNEAKAAASLDHPNIVHVHSVGCERGMHYYAMQYIEGQTLAEVIGELKRVSGAVSPGKQDGQQAGDSHAVSRLTRDFATGRLAPSDDKLPSGDSTPGIAAVEPVSASSAETGRTSRDSQPRGSREKTSSSAVPSPPGRGHGEGEENGDVVTSKPLSSTDGSTRSREFFRTIAHLGIQASEALEHAHQLGVVHRDIKPSNLMVDTSGHLWITDFGLAMTRSEANLTMTGDILGTLRYMSPEQAEGHHGILDHHTDIYSLAVTLYELLTLRPAFPGDDRQKLLRDLSAVEPSRPRQFNRAIPVDLETIVGKAMSKEPKARYATAQALADDLKRFLADEPIRARRPSLATRGAKWARRHKPVIWSAAVVLFIAVVALAVCTVLIGRAYQREREQRELAQRQRERAEANFQKATEAVDQMLTEVATGPLAQTPRMEPVRRALLEKALAFYEGFLEEKSTDPQVRQETGRAHLRVADVARRLARKERALQAFREAIAVFEKLQADFPDKPEYKYHLAESHNKLGWVIWNNRRGPEAEPAFREALNIQKQLVAEFPQVVKYHSQLAEIHLSFGLLHVGTGRLKQAEQDYLEGLRIYQQLAAESAVDPEHRSNVAWLHLRLGGVRRDTGRFRGTEESCRAGLNSWEELVAEFPENGIYRDGLASCHAWLGSVLFSAGRRREAEQSYRTALDMRQQLADDLPTIPEYRHDLGLSHIGLGALYEITGRHKEAENAFSEARRIWQQLVDESPAHPELNNRLAWSHDNLGVVLNNTGRYAAAEESHRKALRIRQQLAEETPSAPEFREYHAWSLNHLGSTFENMGGHGVAGAYEQAEGLYRQSLTAYRQLAEEYPQVPQYRAFVSTIHRHLAQLHAQTGQFEEGEKLLLDGLVVAEQLVREFPHDPRYRVLLIALYRHLAVFQAKAGELDKAETSLGEALKVTDQLIIDFPDVPDKWQRLPDTWLALSVVRLGISNFRGSPELCDELLRVFTGGDHIQIPGWQFDSFCELASIDADDLEQLVELAEKSVTESPGDSRANLVLACILYRAGRFEKAAELLDPGNDDYFDAIWLSMIHHQLGHSEQAREFFQKACQLMDAPIQDQRYDAGQKLELKLLRHEAAALLRSAAARQQLLEATLDENEKPTKTKNTT